MTMNIKENTSVFGVEKIQKEIRNYLKTSDFINPSSITLTLKKGIRFYSDSGFGYNRLDEMKISNNLRYFLNRLNQKVYGSSCRRYGNKIPTISIYEWEQTNPHIHLLMDRPDHIDEDLWIYLIQSNWSKTPFGNHQIKVVPTYDENGWIDYITKVHSKDIKNHPDHYDWVNTNLPSTN